MIWSSGRVTSPALSIPPPSAAAELPEMVELETVNVPVNVTPIPPPLRVAELPVMVELVTVKVPPTATPPPEPAVFCAIVEPSW